MNAGQIRTVGLRDPHALRPDLHQIVAAALPFDPDVALPVQGQAHEFPPVLFDHRKGGLFPSPRIKKQSGQAGGRQDRGDQDAVRLPEPFGLHFSTSEHMFQSFSRRAAARS